MFDKYLNKKVRILVSTKSGAGMSNGGSLMASVLNPIITVDGVLSFVSDTFIEIENSRKKQIDEVNKYKEEVLGKLTDKKEEIEKRLNLLKESQATLEKEKQEFEKHKKEETEKIEKVQKEVQAAYDDRREELGHIEDVLRKQKDALDEERSQLSLDRIQYESDKNELANNLLKFNELVNSFKSGVSDIKE